MGGPAERLRQRARERHGDAVLRYASGVLLDDGEARQVASATLAAARALSRRRTLIDAAHLLCRELAEAELGPDALAAQERTEALPPQPGDACAAAELAASRALDGALPAGERALLARHLDACAACARRAAAVRAQRAALRLFLGRTQVAPAGGVHTGEGRSRPSPPGAASLAPGSPQAGAASPQRRRPPPLAAEEGAQ